MIDTNIISSDDRIINIKAHDQLLKSEILNLNLPARLDDNLQFTYDILIAYDTYMQKKAALVHRRVNFYKQISYTFLDNDGRFYSYINLHVGNVVQIKEESGISFAIIKALFTHKYNDGSTYAFVWINWLRESLTIDPILQCPVYEVQKAENVRWHRVYPIALIIGIPKVHFVHRCGSACTSTSHDLSNNQYFRNDFYYTAI